jgi:hypothetical protein
VLQYIEDQVRDRNVQLAVKHSFAQTREAWELIRAKRDQLAVEQARALNGIAPLPPSPTTLSRVRESRARRRYEAALDVVALYQRYIARLDRGSIRDAIENRALIVSRDSVLVELHCAFDTIRHLRATGWVAPSLRLVRPPLIFQGRRRDATVDVYFQHEPPALALGSRYRGVQSAHSFPHASGLIPDIVVKRTDPMGTRWLLIEVKWGTKRRVADYARAATHDLLAYRRAYDHVLANQPGIYGLGYAWGRALEPSTDSEIMLCSPDTLADALERVL